MSGSRSLAEYVADQLAPLGEVTMHRYFGGWYCAATAASSR
ncbi:hypothetical protein ABT300_30745 [Streptomyces sp. NPDC001027]